MRIRPRQILRLVLLLVVAGPGLFTWSYHYLAKREMESYRKQLVAAGEKLTVDELIPIPVRPDQNAAELLSQAYSRLNRGPSVFWTNEPPAMRLIAPGKAMLGWAQLEIRDPDQNTFTNTWAEAEADLAKSANGLELLRMIVERPSLDFARNYHEGLGMLQFNGALLHQAERQLSTATVCDLHRVNVSAATANLRALLALVKGSTDEHLAISQHVRQTIAANTFSLTWELLQSPAAIDGQLAKLQRDWMELEFLQAMEDALAMHRARGEITIEAMRDSPAVLQKMIPGYQPLHPGGWLTGFEWVDEFGKFAANAWQQVQWKTKETTWRVAWSYPDQLRALKGLQVLLDTSRLVRSNGCFQTVLLAQQRDLGALGISEAAVKNYSPWDQRVVDARRPFSQWAFSHLEMPLPYWLEQVMMIEGGRALTITAIALKRYQLRHGSTPTTLDALVPELLPAVPRDPVDGQPLRYHLDGDGTYLLYSVGKDGVDNHGDPRPAHSKRAASSWKQGRDWVWPKPASPTEVEGYFEALRRKRSPPAEEPPSLVTDAVAISSASLTNHASK